MVLDLWSPKEKISLQDQDVASVTQNFVARVLLKWKGIEKDSDREHFGRGQKSAPHSS